jgi:EAL domain-containing protein (putative c-di-GMP-specific phosphodiesterase class I)
MSRLEHISDVALAINLFPGSITDASFNDWLLAQLKQQPGIASRLIFEIAEYGVLENANELRNWVDRIRGTGARTSIDHFGKGFASFGYLCETRVDYLKIDGSFISDIEQNKDHRFFVESIIGIAHSLDIKVVAESVETEGEMRTLTTLGVDALQGYGIQPPAPWQEG